MNKNTVLKILFLTFLLLINISPCFLVGPTKAEELPVKVYVKPPDDYVEYPITITSIETLSVSEDAGVKKLTLIIIGTNFSSDSIVYVNGIQVIVKFIDSNNIQIITDVVESGIYKIEIVNPDNQKATHIYNYTVPIIEELPKTGTFEDVVKQINEIIVNQIIPVIKTPQAQAQIAASSSITSAIAISGTIDYLKLLFIPYKKRRKYWGIVYEKSNRKPVPFTLIELHDSKSGKLVKTSVSDMDGRYGIIADPGDYYLEIKHGDFVFDSSSGDPDAYKGQKFQTSQSQNVSFNIVLLGNLEGSISIKYQIRILWNNIFKIFGILYPYLLGALLVLNIIFFLLTSQTIYFIIVLYHIALFGYYLYINNKFPKQWGICFDAISKKGIKNTIVKLFNTTDNTLVDNKMADFEGRYQFILPKGKYQLIAQATGYTFPSRANTVLQDERGRVILDSTQKVLEHDIPLDKSLPQTLEEVSHSNKFGVLE